MATQETATYLAFVTLTTEEGELPEELDAVADLISFQMGDDYLTEPPPYGSGMKCLAVSVSTVDRGQGFELGKDNDGQIVIYTGVYQP